MVVEHKEGMQVNMRGDRMLNILMLVDNTATMNRTTDDKFPFISYAKSAIQTLLEADRSRIMRFSLTIAFSNEFGKPTCITCQGPPTPPAISYLQISPTGSFDETVIEGLTEFNNQRVERLRDCYDTFFAPPVARRHDTYVVAFFSDFVTLSRQFHQLSCGEIGRGGEWMLRPDESIMFFSPSTTDNTTYLVNEFRESLQHVPIEFIPLTQAYAPLFVITPAKKILHSEPVFQFTMIFESERRVNARLALKTMSGEMGWPLPYDFTATSIHLTNTAIPEYFCFKSDIHMDIRKLRPDVYGVEVFTNEPMEIGHYLVATNYERNYFAILIIEENSAEMRVLPWNFIGLADLLRGVPAKDDCNRFLYATPVPYIDRCVRIFSENSLSFSPDVASPRLPKTAQQRKQERDKMVQRDQCVWAETSFFINPTVMDTSTLSHLMDHVQVAKCEYRLTKAKTSIGLNLDTMDDVTMSTLDPARSKMSVSKIYEKIPSLLTDEMVKNMLNVVNEVPPEEPVAREPEVKDISEIFKMDEERDKFTLLEDLLALLRDKDAQEIEKRLKQLEGNVELLSFVKLFLRQSMERFQIVSAFPESFLAKLTG